MDHHRVVVKLGTNLLTGGSDHLNLETMSSLVGQIARLHARGLELVVVSSGAIAAGRQRLKHVQEDKNVPFRQVLAAVGQSRLMDAYDQLFTWHEITIAQTLLTRNDFTHRHSYLNARNTLLALLRLGVIPIVNENDVVAVEEIEDAVFGDNDTLSALVAILTDADLLVLLTDTGGLFDADPHLEPSAKLVSRVDRIDAAVEGLAHLSHSMRGTGGMATKIEAAKLATASGIAVIIAGGREPEILQKLISGESHGTFFQPTSTKLESRKRWLLSQISRGMVLIDSGAVKALRLQNKSLLPVGIDGTRGRFERGDIVSILDSRTEEKIACGISSYSSDEIEVIRGSHSDKIMERLGYEYGTEIVHRDNLVIL
ncbi:MAG: glutamate 5-kinase [Dehalococcoidia bacterium]|nr:glutamate 5-kinase [Dehalococcoidia bacterium]